MIVVAAAVCLSFGVLSVAADTASPPKNTVAPSVTGTAAAFQTVTCAPGQWTPAGLSFTYLWALDGSSEGMPATQSWKLDPTQVDHRISCDVTAADPATGLRNVAASAEVSVTQGEIANTAPPVLSGAPSLAKTLSCSTGTWSPTPDAYSYQWLRDGLTIAAATNAEYTVASRDVTHKLTCQVVATIGNNAASGNATSAALIAEPSAPGLPVNTLPPAITGTPTTGETASCSTGSWTNSPASYNYLWLLDGHPLPGETAQTHSIGAADAGHELACEVTAMNGAGPASATSAAFAVTPTAAGAVALVNIAAPHIVGVAKAGATVSCDPGSWTGNRSFSYALLWSQSTRVPRFTRTARRLSFGVTQTGYFSHAIAHSFLEVGRVGTTRTLVVPDLPAARGTLDCSVTATEGSRTVVASSAPVPLEAEAPVLTRGRNHRLITPYVNPTVGSGGTNTCLPGAWAHYPAFAYAWYWVGAASKVHPNPPASCCIEARASRSRSRRARGHRASSGDRRRRLRLRREQRIPRPRERAVALQPPLIESKRQTQLRSRAGGSRRWVMRSPSRSRLDLSQRPPDSAVCRFDRRRGSARPCARLLPRRRPAAAGIDMRPGNREYDLMLECVVSAISNAWYLIDRPLRAGPCLGRLYKRSPARPDNPSAGTFQGPLGAISEVSGGIPGLLVGNGNGTIYTYGPNCARLPGQLLPESAGYTVSSQRLHRHPVEPSRAEDSKTA